MKNPTTSRRSKTAPGRESSDRLERDRKFILEAGEWPKWPVLPLKRRDGDAAASDRCAFLLNGFDRERPVVYLALIYHCDRVATKIMDETKAKSVTWEEIVERLPSRQFDSLEALLGYYTVD
jgi:hypothetical protein